MVGRLPRKKRRLCCQASKKWICLPVSPPLLATAVHRGRYPNKQKAIANASILFANIILCILYLLPHFIVYSVLSAQISLPIIRPLYRLLQELGRLLWCPYWAARWGMVHAGGTAAGRPTGDCRSGVVRRTSAASDSAKNRLNSTGTAGDQRGKGPRKRGRDDDEKAPPSKNVKLDSGQFPNQFACPFYLHDRHEWSNCLRNYRLNRVVDVRLHLLRVHLLAPQCPSCGKEFKGDSAEDRCNEHIEQRSCQPLPHPPPPRHGLTGDQLEAIRSIASHRTGRREQLDDPAAAKWFEMWDIIFPNTAHPASPYITEHPDIQRILDMNQLILRETSPTLLNMSRSALTAMMDALLAYYRRLYQGLDGSTPEVSAATAANTSVTSPGNTSLHQRPDGVLPSANRQPVQAIEEFIAPRILPAAAAGPSQWMEPPNAYTPAVGRRHNSTFAQGTQPISPFASGPQSFTHAQAGGSDLDLQEIDDLFETSESFSQLFNNSGPQPPWFLSNFDMDAADEA